MVVVILILALAIVVVAVIYLVAFGLANKAGETDDLLDRLEWEARKEQRIVYPPERKP